MKKLAQQNGLTRARQTTPRRLASRLARRMSRPRAYVDTCIVSGLAKGELSTTDVDALRHILEAHKTGRIELIASPLVRKEIEKIPAEYRSAHSVIYNLLADVPLAKTQQRTPPFRPIDFPFGLRKAPLLEKLEALLPDETDAEHVFHAVNSGVRYLLTVDRRTMVARSDAVSRLCGVQLLDPCAFRERVLS